MHVSTRSALLVVRHCHRAVNHEGRPLSTGTGSGIRSVGKISKCVPSATAASPLPTWLAGFQYQFTDAIMGFAKVSTGFRSGGFNPASGTTPFIEFQPEDDRSYELGARMDFFD